MNETRPSLRILLIEDNPGDARLIGHHLQAPGVDRFTGDLSLTHRETLSEGLEELSAEPPGYDLLFLDLNLPDSSGLETLDRVVEKDFEVPIVVLTGLEDRDAAVNAIQRGAQDYVPKPRLDADRLARSLRYAVERHQQEQELRRQNQRLERFASMVSHDLRSPLNVALNRTMLAQESGDGEHLDHAVEALDRMGTIVQDLLALTMHGQRVAETEEVRLSAITERTWNFLDTDGADVTIETDTSFHASSDRVQALLENLFRNALDHGADDVQIRVGVIDEPTGFYVADDGPGINDDMQDMVFEFGYTTRDEGIGIGLAIVKEIADAHGWDCTIGESAHGGARFEFTHVHPAED